MAPLPRPLPASDAAAAAPVPARAPLATLTPLGSLEQVLASGQSADIKAAAIELAMEARARRAVSRG